MDAIAHRIGECPTTPEDSAVSVVVLFAILIGFIVVWKAL
jgi:hypothetical protein